MFDEVVYYLLAVLVVAGIPALLSWLIGHGERSLFRGLERQPRVLGLQAPYLFLAAFMAALAGAFAASFSYVGGDVENTMGLVAVLAMVMVIVNLICFLVCMDSWGKLLVEEQELSNSGLSEASPQRKSYNRAVSDRCELHNRVGHATLVLSISIIVGGVWVV